MRHIIKESDKSDYIVEKLKEVVRSKGGLQYLQLLKNVDRTNKFKNEYQHDAGEFLDSLLTHLLEVLPELTITHTFTTLEWNECSSGSHPVDKKESNVL